MANVIYSEEPNFKPIILQPSRIWRSDPSKSVNNQFIHIKDAPKFIWESYNYELHFFKIPKIKLLRKIIAQSSEYAYKYAHLVICKRFPEAESVIMQDTEYAYKYAACVINDRWPEAEPYIRQDPELWKKYCDYFNIQ